MQTLEIIRARFGERVARIVDGCTDAYQLPKPPWKERKEEYIEHLRSVPADVRLVSLADKVHNARSILADLRWQGSQTWEKFNGGKQGTLWYYQTLAEVFQTTGDDPLTSEFNRLVDEMERLAGSQAVSEGPSDE
jgi:(p)ppGpp synthase/HD superfamily hydrolase